jgi:hypothetical protein
MMPHLSDREIEAYRGGTAPPDALLAADDHLAACTTCRSRAAAVQGAGRGVDELQEAVLPVESHFTDEQVAALVEDPTDRVPAALREHLVACRTCAREVDALRGETSYPAAGRRRIAYAVAAAAVIAVVVPAVLLWRSGAPGGASLAGLESLPRDARQRVEEALRAGAAQPPADLRALGGAREALMGASPPATLRVSAPLGTVQRGAQPTFRWEPLPGATSYVVTITDEAVRPIDRSPDVSGTAWTPARPLPRGRTYLWQVTATTPAGPLTAPAPPAPPARFKVLDAETAAVLEATARAHPQSHLLLGLLYVQAGLIAEARAELLAVPAADPHADVAQRTLAGLRAY